MYIDLYGLTMSKHNCCSSPGSIPMICLQQLSVVLTHTHFIRLLLVKRCAVTLILLQTIWRSCVTFKANQRAKITLCCDLLKMFISIPLSVRVSTKIKVKFMIGYYDWLGTKHYPLVTKHQHLVALPIFITYICKPQTELPNKIKIGLDDFSHYWYAGNQIHCESLIVSGFCRDQTTSKRCIIIIQHYK